MTVIDELPLGIFGRPASANGRPQQDATPRKQSRRHSSDGDENSKEIDDLAVDNASDAVETASRVEALVNGLQISSQLARNSEKHYGLLISVFTAQKLYWILTGSNHTAAAKCCNLIGNLCR